MRVISLNGNNDNNDEHDTHLNWSTSWTEGKIWFAGKTGCKEERNTITDTIKNFNIKEWEK